MVDTVIQIVGLMGAALLVYGFYQVSLEKLKPATTQFQLINMVGAFLLLINTLYFTAYGAAALNIFWVLIAISQLLKLRKQ